MPNSTRLRPDDIAAISRIDPVTTENVNSFTHKKIISAANSISVQGGIQFRRGQGMQGVNVVLRPMIPAPTCPMCAIR